MNVYRCAIVVKTSHGDRDYWENLIMDLLYIYNILITTKELENKLKTLNTPEIIGKVRTLNKILSNTSKKRRSYLINNMKKQVITDLDSNVILYISITEELKELELLKKETLMI